MSDLPREMEEEVLSKLPVTSLGEVRSTCKKWNSMTKGESFLKRHMSEAAEGEAKKKQKQSKGIEIKVVILLEKRVSLMSVNLLYPSIEPIGNINADGVDISKIIHCDGLFLCITEEENSSRVVVLNPYLGQTRWIEPRTSYHRFDSYALGYDNKKKHKVLRFVNDYDPRVKHRVCEFEIYSLDLTHGSLLMSVPTSTGPLRLSPWLVSKGQHLLRRAARGAVSGKTGAPVYTVEIWISSKIEPNAVSWSSLFLAVDMRPLIGVRFNNYAASFFVDEEEKLAVVLHKDRGSPGPTTRNTACIVGDNGYFKQVDLGESKQYCCFPLVSSYVPSSVQIEQPAILGSQKNTP
ncbi:unnamed protein product [Microthlaspi erraticum]|uniref:F-box domain-containing protein n=1 Tax=Microthlaspi erraticum TaxID=1685480 RepID=A0A6D2L2G8_9BRAS|nr:unnamed protein product [Microthlaspi erraticum]